MYYDSFFFPTVIRKNIYVGHSKSRVVKAMVPWHPGYLGRCQYCRKFRKIYQWLNDNIAQTKNLEELKQYAK